MQDVLALMFSDIAIVLYESMALLILIVISIIFRNKVKMLQNVQDKEKNIAQYGTLEEALRNNKR